MVVVSWYDRRSTSGNSVSYEFWGRISTDNGATWGVDQTISDVISPQPNQPDPYMQGCYAGDYNYASILVLVNFSKPFRNEISYRGADRLHRVPENGNGGCQPRALEEDLLPPRSHFLFGDHFDLRPQTGLAAGNGAAANFS